MAINIGDSVTWGSGDPAGRVEMLYTDSGRESHAPEQFAKVVLTKEVVSPCGKRWPAGTSVSLPASELRVLQ